MKQSTRTLIILYVVLVLLKVSLTSFVSSPTIFSDEYIYSKMAQSFSTERSFDVHGVELFSYPPLYPMVLSLAYVVKDMGLVYFFMKLLNALMSSMIILPAFLLAKEFLKTREALLISGIIGVIPSTFAFSSYLLSENLFYPLFLFAIYFLYKSFTEKEYKWDVLAGVFIGLSILTRMIGLVLILVAILMFMIKIWEKEFREIKRKVIMGMITLASLLPWLLAKSQGFLQIWGGEVAKRVDPYVGNALVITLAWIVMYLGFVILSSGIVFFIGNLMGFKERLKNRKLRMFSLISLTTIIVTIILVSYYNAHGFLKQITFFTWLSGRPIGRYLDTILPLLILNGFIGFSYYYKKKSQNFSKLLIASFVIALASMQLMFFKLLPVNNMSLAWLGALKYAFNRLFLGVHGLSNEFTLFYPLLFVVAASVLFSVIYFLHNKKMFDLRRVIYLFMIFFLTLSILNISMTAYDAKRSWLTHEQTQLGLWINKNIKEEATFVFDEDSCTGRNFKTSDTICHPKHHTTLAGFWINNKITIGSIDEQADYILSRKQLDLSVVHETSEGTYLYTTK